MTSYSSNELKLEVPNKINMDSSPLLLQYLRRLINDYSVTVGSRKEFSSYLEAREMQHFGKTQALAFNLDYKVNPVELYQEPDETFSLDKFRLDVDITANKMWEIGQFTMSRVYAWYTVNTKCVENKYSYLIMDNIFVSPKIDKEYSTIYLQPTVRFWMLESLLL